MNSQKSILEMARGALMERADYELERVIENILDANTPPDKKRKLTVTLELTPSGNRSMVAISASAKKHTLRDRTDSGTVLDWHGQKRCAGNAGDAGGIAGSDGHGRDRTAGAAGHCIAGKSSHASG